MTAPARRYGAISVLLRPRGFAGILQCPDLGVDTHDDGVQRDLQIVRFFRGAQAPRISCGFPTSFASSRTLYASALQRSPDLAY